MDIVCRTSNRLFSGLPLCVHLQVPDHGPLDNAYAPPGRDEDYLALNKQFTIDVFTGAQIINLFPSFLKP